MIYVTLERLTSVPEAESHDSIFEEPEWCYGDCVDRIWPSEIAANALFAVLFIDQQQGYWKRRGLD